MASLGPKNGSGREFQDAAKESLRSLMIGRLAEIDPLAAKSLLAEWRQYTIVSARTTIMKFNSFDEYVEHRYYEAAIP